MKDLLLMLTILMLIAKIQMPKETLPVEVPQEIAEMHYTDAEIDLMARTVYAEAGNQDEKGMRLVVSVILNRAENQDEFKSQNTIMDVITAQSQFVTADWATQECYNAVYKELNERTDYRVLWFYSTGYPPYGTQLFKHGGHYFTGKEE